MSGPETKGRKATLSITILAERTVEDVREVGTSRKRGNAQGFGFSIQIKAAKEGCAEECGEKSLEVISLST